MRKVVGVIILAGLLSGCAPVDFSNAPTDSAGNLDTPVDAGPQCDVQSVERLTKILFVVDRSGSNVNRTRNNGTLICTPSEADYNQCLPATDPQKAFRAGAIQNFFSQYASKTNFDWSFITFNETSAQALIGSGNTPSFSETSTQMQQAINTFMGLPDQNGTPYEAALELATLAVRNDRDLNAASQPQYLVIMLSDGFPTDYSVNGQMDQVALRTDIQSLLSLAPGRVSLSTIYYGLSNDANAIALLRSMAQQGSGQFANVNDSSTGISINDIVPVQICD